MSTKRTGPHRDLIVWRKSMLLAAAVYKAVRYLPAEERFELGSQMRQAAVSIPLNIAEGKGRRTDPDFARFLAQARGSARELDTILGISEMCRLIDPARTRRAVILTDEVSRMLTTMLKTLTPL